MCWRSRARRPDHRGANRFLPDLTVRQETPFYNRVMAPDLFSLSIDVFAFLKAALMAQPVVSALGIGAAVLWIAGNVFTLAFQNTRA